jgi:hypothetical protein
LRFTFLVQEFDKVVFRPSTSVLNRFSLAFREELECGEALYFVFFGQGGVLFIVGIQVCDDALQE